MSDVGALRAGERKQRPESKRVTQRVLASLRRLTDSGEDWTLADLVRDSGLRHRQHAERVLFRLVAEGLVRVEERNFNKRIWVPA